MNNPYPAEEGRGENSAGGRENHIPGSLNELKEPSSKSRVQKYLWMHCLEIELTFANAMH
jgi:hypothetical protein